ncbi:HAMP domain-containing histidine kinase [Macrococcus hajekii]|uniref:histidine kinase n=1 Tax=Macrococcus hajekii TaxID=198482 RepID=A0A4V3BDR4_9STAP|nr:HAMP domain-containing sensor histidine kinase [Macrococcus hajekii]TDM01132.1 HAMP domain-containing histidine kinase [Macrococcus hajekii]GGB12204.1 two-component sensor histidine kinase [Macrococcus hajekii]
MKATARKFTWKFIGYFSLFYVLINLMLLLLLGYSMMRSYNELSGGNLSSQTTDTIQTLIHIEDANHITIDDELSEALKKQEGMLLIRDNKGNVIKSFNNKEKIHNLSWYYLPGVTTWTLDKKYQAVFIDRQPLVKATELFDLRETVDLHRYMDEHNLSLFKQDMESDQLIKLYGSFKTEDVEKNWFSDLNYDNYNKYVLQETMRDDEYYLFVSENQNAKDKRIILDENGIFMDKDGAVAAILNFLLWYCIFSLAIFLIILTLAYFVSRNFARPLIHFVDWLSMLRQGVYKVPDNKSIYRRGRMRRKYRMYTSVDESIRELTEKLDSDRAYQNRIATLREEWVAGITHDFKTPLSSIYGYSKLLNSELDIDHEERKRFAEIIEDKALYIDSLLRDLNMTYQIKNDVFEFNKQTVNIGDYIQAFIDSFNHPNLHTANALNQTLKLDKERINRVLMNIVSNAFIYNDDIEVWINTFVEGDDIVIEISDNGRGIPQEEVPYIFDRYYRGTNTTSKNEGSGLGLAVAKQIVENHNGTITVHSSIAGTKFRIKLPKE